MGTPNQDSPLVTLGLNLTRSCRYLHDTQGVSKLDLIWVLHGIMGQVLSWEEDDKNAKVSEGEEFPTEGRGFDPSDDFDDP